MTRLVLIHAPVPKAADRAALLRGAGFDVDVHSGDGGSPALRPLRDDPPDVFVVDLDRRPAHGRDVAGALRGWKATRQVPIVFAGGAPEKVEATRRRLPDAVYAPWDEIKNAVKQALTSPPPAESVVPQPMAGYSGTPLPKKLGVKADATLLLLAAPEGFETTLGTLPEGVRTRRQARGPGDVVMLFARSRAELLRRFPSAVRALADGGRLWLAWPKKASGLASDLGQVDVRAYGLDRGLVDFKICAVDATWSALCFVRRRTPSVKRSTGDASR